MFSALKCHLMGINRSFRHTHTQGLQHISHHLPIFETTKIRPSIMMLLIILYIYIVNISIVIPESRKNLHHLHHHRRSLLWEMMSTPPLQSLMARINAPKPSRSKQFVGSSRISTYGAGMAWWLVKHGIGRISDDLTDKQGIGCAKHGEVPW